MRQADRPSDGPNLTALVAAVGYLAGLVIVAGLLLFGVPLAVLVIGEAVGL